MIRHLHVRNLAVIEQASLEFGPGLNVVTGETGAGKSLVVDSLSLLAGGRARTDQIRSGADSLSITGVFEPETEDWRRPLEEAGIDCETPELVVRREVSRAGRNQVFLNDQPVTLRLLAAVGPELLRIHGQRDELELVEEALQRRWLDAVGGASGDKLVAKCANRYADYAELAARLERLTSDDRARHERLDLLSFQRSEIAAAAVERDEERGLRSNRDQLRNAEAIVRGLTTAVQLLSDDENAASARLARAEAALEPIRSWIPDGDDVLGQLAELRVRADDLSHTLRGALDGLDADPRKLDEVEDRLAVLERLMRKYGGSTQTILEHLATAEEELAQLELDDDRLAELEESVAALLDGFRAVASELSTKRQKWGKALARSVGDELRDLALEKARFEVELSRQVREGSPLVIEGEPTHFGAWGVDRVSFVFSSNPGQELQALSKVASGGELARVYLALQVAARGDGTADPSSLVFDEVDAGVGGFEAAMVGRKLRRLAQGGQILAVTHLPQVASCGDRHFRITKSAAKNKTQVRVEGLEHQERVREIARMLAGEEITDLSIRHAEELLASIELEA